MNADEDITKEKESIFISCRHEDLNIAKVLKLNLTRIASLCGVGIEVVLYDVIQGGVEYRTWIEEKIRSAKVLIFIYTDDQAAYRWCHFEMGLYKGLHYNSEYKLIGIVSPLVKGVTDPIANLQSYNGDKNGLKRLFKDLFFGIGSILGNINSTEKFVENTKDVDCAISEISSQFTPLILKRNLLPELTIELSRTYTDESTCGGDRIDEIQIEMAPLHFERAETLMRSPQINYSWKELYFILKERHQHAWMDTLKEIIEKMRSSQYCGHPFADLSTISLGCFGNSTAIFSSFEKFRDRISSSGCGPQEHKDTIKKAVVNFIPIQKVLRDFRSIFDDEIEEIYAPASIVRVKWKRMGGIGDYLMDDIVEAPDVVKFNKPFQKLFNLSKNAGKKGEASLTVNVLLDKLKKEECIDYLEELEKDQARLSQKIVFDCVSDTATVPLQFNHRHPEPKYRGKAYLPYMICKQTIGNTNGPHETLYFICYILDFWPVGYLNKNEKTGY